MTHHSSLVRLLAGGTFASFSSADFRRLYVGNVASQLSIWMQQIVFGWLLLERGNSPFWLGLGGLLNGLTMTLLSPVSGAMADALDRRRIMYFTHGLLLGVNAAVLGLLALGWLDIWHLLLGSVCMGIIFSLNMPARQSWTMEIVGRQLLQNATALHGLSLNVSRILGPILAGGLMAAVGPAQVLAINLAANTLTLVQLSRIAHRPARPSSPVRLRGSELLEGFRYCWQQRDLRAVFATVCVSSFLGMAFIQLLPALARDELRLGPDGLGMLMAAMGGGAVVGALLVARRGRMRRKGLILHGVAALLGLTLVGMGLSRWLPLTFLFLALAGLSNSLLFALGVSAVCELVPDRLAGRAMAVFMLTLGLTSVGSFPAGAIATALGTGSAIALYGSLCCAASVGLFLLLGARAGRARRALTEPATVHAYPPRRAGVAPDAAGD